MLDSGERSIKNKNSQFKKTSAQKTPAMTMTRFGSHTSGESGSHQWGAEMREADIFADLQGE
ncbi:MAG: hypothetical protein EAZ34_00365 [Polaromonas sp.]|nr:MAG: hypothetical protein EAZ34_00365 [Polaromonas sp.]